MARYGKHRTFYENHYHGTIDADYDVHHIDENKMNNEISNLVLISHKDHVTLHKAGNPAWNKGIPMSEEQKKKLSVAKIGKPSNHKGCKASAETLEKMRLASLGRKWNADQKAAQSDWAKEWWAKRKQTARMGG